MSKIYAEVIELQKTKETCNGWAGNDDARRSRVGAVTEVIRRTETEPMVSLERILEQQNFTEAYKRVLANKGAAGVDSMEVDELEGYLRAHPHQLSQAIRDGSYRPMPVRRCYIPKDNGEKRPLGIPTVVDRLVQQAVAQVLMQEYEPVFSKLSFGFRPWRGAHDAIDAVADMASQGYEYAIDLDLSKFFDTVNHAKMMQVLSKRIKDGRVISLIHHIFRAKISEDGKCTQPEMGMPQGGPLSPVCANILLNELDQELDRRGHKFARYADDMIILCKSQRAAERTYASIKKFIEKELKLKINEDKTKVCKLSDDIKFLGYTYYKRKARGKEIGADTGRMLWAYQAHQKAVDKYKRTVKKILDRRCPKGLEETKKKLAAYVTGWYNYFRMGMSKSKRRELDGWMRRRIRQMYWKIWKKTITKFRALVKLGVDREKAYQWANSSKAYWRVAGSWILSSTLTNKRLKELGWVGLEDREDASNVS